MKEESGGNHICILKTGKLFEHDSAANALSENGIPYYKQMETSSGLRLAMPFQPAMGPGTWYNIFVHPKYAEEAKAILNELPIDLSTDPDIWHFGPNKRIKKAWKILIWISLAVGFLLLILGLIQNIV
jgi:hypothetical protein